jgi:hypothetical protein
MSILLPTQARGYRWQWYDETLEVEGKRQEKQPTEAHRSSPIS